MSRPTINPAVLQATREQERQRERDRRRQLQRQRNRESPTWMKAAKVISAVVSVLASFVTIIAFVSVVSVHASMENAFTLNPEQPFTTRFRVKNDSYMYFNHLTMTCAIDSGNLGVNLQNVGFTGWQKPVDLAPGGVNETEPCSIGTSSGQVRAASVRIIISYNPAWFPWHTNVQTFRFDTEQASDGNLVWVQSGSN